MEMILYIAGYVLIAFLLLKSISILTANINPYIRFFILSFLYSLFCGIGIAGNDGDPGFAFPAPNIVAITLMYKDNFYRGIEIAFYILAFWWLLIFAIMYISHIIKQRKMKESAQLL